MNTRSTIAQQVEPFGDDAGVVVYFVAGSIPILRRSIARIVKSLWRAGIFGMCQVARYISVGPRNGYSISYRPIYRSVTCFRTNTLKMSATPS